jgi:NADH:ubiquinone oxidoreductase subunit E
VSPVKKIERIEHVVLICMGSDCKKNGARAVLAAAKDCIGELGCKRTTHLVKTRCQGLCKHGPIVSVQPANHWLVEATPKKVCGLLEETLTKP